MNRRFDILVANPLGRALFSEMYADPTCGANTVRFAFLSPAARRFYVARLSGKVHAERLAQLTEAGVLDRRRTTGRLPRSRTRSPNAGGAWPTCCTPSSNGA